MLRNLILSFSRHLKVSHFNRHDIQKVGCIRNFKTSYVSSYISDNLDQSINVEEQKQSTDCILDTDDYVSDTQYNMKQITNPQMQLELRLKITPTQLDKLCRTDPKLKSEMNRFNFNKVIDVILANGITKQSIIENPFILRMSPDNLQQKIKKLQEMKYKNINDLVPLLRISVQRLSKIAVIMSKDSDSLKPISNRIYYLSEKLNVEPKIISKYLSRRVFMLMLPLNSLIEILNYMIEFGINRMNILKDLWAFRYPPDVVRDRLRRAAYARKDKIMPWMVRCPERIFQKSLKLSLDQQLLLGENSIVDYLSQRLGLNKEVTMTIMSKHPAVYKVRIKKVKEVLDYLLDEAGFSTYDIARVPRVLCHKLETTKLRLEELKSHGCTPSSLIIVCRSKREYEKFLRSWISIENKIKNKNRVTN